MFDNTAQFQDNLMMNVRVLKPWLHGVAIKHILSKSKSLKGKSKEAKAHYLHPMLDKDYPTITSVLSLLLASTAQLSWVMNALTHRRPLKPSPWENPWLWIDSIQFRWDQGIPKRDRAPWHGWPWAWPRRRSPEGRKVVTAKQRGDSFALPALKHHHIHWVNNLHLVHYSECEDNQQQVLQRKRVEYPTKSGKSKHRNRTRGGGSFQRYY